MVSFPKGVPLARCPASLRPGPASLSLQLRSLQLKSLLISHSDNEDHPGYFWGNITDIRTWQIETLLILARRRLSAGSLKQAASLCKGLPTP
jgi:hypothetical protein